MSLRLNSKLYQAKMRALFLDTETTGLPKNKYKSAYEQKDNWPEPVSLSWIVTEGPTVVTAKSFIIKPQGWQIPEDSVKIHGISQEFAEKNGYDLEQVMHIFSKDIRSCDMVIAHNLEFDKNVILNIIIWHIKNDNFIKWPRKEFCTSENGRAICKLSYANPRPPFAYKQPKLSEFYKQTFGTLPPQEMLHNSLGDVQILVSVFFRHWSLEQAASYVREEPQSPNFQKG